MEELERRPGTPCSGHHSRRELLSRQGTITTSLRSMVGSNRNTHSTCLQAQPFLRCDHPLPFQVLKRLIKTQGWLRRRSRDIEHPNLRKPVQQSNLHGQQPLKCMEQKRSSKPATPLLGARPVVKLKRSIGGHPRNHPGPTIFGMLNLIRPKQPV